MKFRYLIVGFFLLGVTRLSFADQKAISCSSSLPAPIRQLVERAYPGWQVASAKILNQEDRQRFKPLVDERCYGIIRGDFTNRGISYALYLLKPQGTGYMNQLVVYQEDKAKVIRHVLIRASYTASAIVLRKLPSKTPIVDANTGRRFLPSYEIINLVDPDKGEISFFWKSGRFIRVSSSE